MRLTPTKHPTDGQQCESCLTGKNISGFKHQCLGVLWAWPATNLQIAKGQRYTIVFGFSPKNVDLMVSYFSGSIGRDDFQQALVCSRSLGAQMTLSWSAELGR
jgi:hypothetical protein